VIAERTAFTALLEARAWLYAGRPALAQVAIADAEHSLAAAERRRELLMHAAQRLPTTIQLEDAL
jgi:hypothetical protein